ncbi:Subtilisin-like protease 1 [Metarhizium brunneum]|uniref:Subtilisin-like protease 1 n=1 Tax=Metarhizium brunneum TaxID=500148 RepID=A0A7D5V425_9HYPO
MKSLHGLVGLLLSASLASSGLVPRDASIPTANQTSENGSIECDKRGTRGTLVSQSNAPANLVRLSNNAIQGVSNYTYDESAGEGITVYVIDGGIRLTHKEFGGRASYGAIFSTILPRNERDYDGHGTHIAGIIGGATYGVAKKVKLVAVRIDSKNASQMIKAADFVIEDVKKKGIQGKAVICMSMHIDASNEVDQKFEEAVDSGVVVVVSAGNNNKDAGNYSPARHPKIITVAAIYDDTDFHWPNSNWGSSVTIYAPGVGIRSAGPASDTDKRLYDGTSQAAPHVAGLAAYIMALEGITEPAKVMSRLISLAEETGSRVHWTDPNTTTLIATNGLAGRLDPAIANKVKKLPWLSPEGYLVDRVTPCGSFYYSDANCGTARYCDSYDRGKPTTPKKGFFKSAQECLDAHEPPPILPWIEKPTIVRHERCDETDISAKCPEACGTEKYDEEFCGTKFICEGFDEKPKPIWAIEYPNTKACFDGHEPQPVSSNQSMPAAAA